MQRVFVDANVFFSRTTRDWICLLRAEIPAMFQLHTTEDVLSEALYQIRRQRPEMDGGAITTIRAHILESIDELLPDFDGSITYSGDDPNDRHVHAAAVACYANTLLTDDTGFEETDDTPYEVYNCDDFFCLIDDAAPERVREVAIKQAKYWASQSSHKSLAEALEDADCPDFAKRVAAHLLVAAGI